MHFNQEYLVNVSVCTDVKKDITCSPSQIISILLLQAI